MPCIWGQHNNSQIFCAVVILPANPLPGGGHLPGSVVFNALVDTGATTTGISKQAATQLQLQPVGKVPIHGVGGVQNHNVYLFRVGFPFAIPTGSPLAAGLPPPPPGQANTQLFVLDKVLMGCEFDGANANFQVILGMDVLSTGSLVVQGNGNFSFSF